MRSNQVSDFPFYMTMYNDMFAQGTVILANRPIAFYDNLSLGVIDFANAFYGHQILKDIAIHNTPFHPSWQKLWDLILSIQVQQIDPSLLAAENDWRIPRIHATYSFNDDTTMDLNLEFLEKDLRKVQHKIDNLKISTSRLFLSLLHLYCQQHIYNRTIQTKYFLLNSEHISKREEIHKVRKSLLQLGDVDQLFQFYMRWLESELLNNDKINLEKYIQTNGIQLLCLFLDVDTVYDFIWDNINRVGNSTHLQQIVLYDVWRMIRMYYHHQSEFHKQFEPFGEDILGRITSRDDFLVVKYSNEMKGVEF